MIDRNSHKLLGLIPDDNIIFHIVGIGGIGMSAIAQIMHRSGLKVQGSDLLDGVTISGLRLLGIQCKIGPHHPSNLGDANVIIHSTAVKLENSELVAARNNGKIILNRHQILSEIIRDTYNVCVSGMHGKTTTTSMIGLIFEHAGLDHNTLVGGVMSFNDKNFFFHENPKWTVLEADESDDSFIKIPRTIAVVTNISQEHLDHHLTFENVKNKFKEFLENLPFYGFSLVCYDDDVVKEISRIVNHPNLFSYSINDPEADFFASEIAILNNEIKFKLYKQKNFLANFELNIFGKFNVSNALGAIAVCYQLGIDLDVIKKALSTFKSTKRRFEFVGNFQGAIVIDDYAHHPREIKATAETAVEFARNRGGKAIGVFQPHRFTRLQKLMEAFSDSFLHFDSLIVLPIYSAGEEEIYGVSSDILIEKIKKSQKNKEVFKCEGLSELQTLLLQITNKNDVILCMGAGDITSIANKLGKDDPKTV